MQNCVFHYTQDWFTMMSVKTMTFSHLMFPIFKITKPIKQKKDNEILQTHLNGKYVHHFD